MFGNSHVGAPIRADWSLFGDLDPSMGWVGFGSSGDLDPTVE